MDTVAVNRFVSTLAGAFRSFYIYNQDNKAFEEILQNLLKRFQDIQSGTEPVQLTITNRSLLFNGESAGFRELTVVLAGTLRNLGYKSIQFQNPIQTRHFFQLFHILTGKDSNDSKNEKLIPLIEDGDPKPISLIPFTSNSFLLKLTDEAIARRLAPLSVPKSQGGEGFVENISSAASLSLPDFLTLAEKTAAPLKGPAITFMRSLFRAVREGYFPWERFLKLFPFPAAERQYLHEKLSIQPAQHIRQYHALGHRYSFRKMLTVSSSKSVDSITRFSAFSTSEVTQHQELKSAGAMSSAAQDLDLAEELLKQQGPDFTFGLSLLIRSMSEKNPMAIQEKALRLAAFVWTGAMVQDGGAAAYTMMSSLRQHLTTVQNISLILFPVRTVTIESSAFMDMSRYLQSLGKACLPGLIASLDAEQDRGMRKKLCVLMTNVAREDGVDVLIEALGKAPAFLTRNLVMVLGDLRAPQMVPALVPLLSHQQKFVRSESVRALCRVGTEDAHRVLLGFLKQTTDDDLKEVARQVLALTKFADQAKNA